MFIKLGLRSSLARNTAWMFIGAGLRVVIQGLYFIAIARTLGANKYGAFIGVLALVGIAVPFGDLGTGNLLVKNVSRDQEPLRDLLGESIGHDGGFWLGAYHNACCFSLILSYHRLFHCGSFYWCLCLIFSG